MGEMAIAIKEESVRSLQRGGEFGGKNGIFGEDFFKVLVHEV